MASNTTLTSSIVTKETLTILENNLVAAAKVNRRFEPQFVEIGSTLTIRKPNRYLVTLGPGLQIQNITEPSTSITITTQAHADFQFSSQELTLQIGDFAERYLKPAAATLANRLDFDVIGNFSAIYNEVGTPGTIPATYAALAAVGQRMDESAAPQDDRTLLLGPAAYWSLSTGLVTLFVQSVAEPALKGFITRLANMSIYIDQNVQVHTVGALGGSPTVNGAAQTGSSLATHGWSNSINGLLTQGDVFTIAGVHAVNPQSRISTGSLQQFVVTSGVNSDGSGNATVPISPAITPTGAYQNVDASPANGAVITVMGTAATSYAQNLAFTQDAFGLVTVPLTVPDGNVFAAREEFRGVSMRVVRQYDINNDVTPCRIDILYGTAPFYPEMAVRLTN